ncbi:MAG TPA: hypothetical protein VGL81_09130 [Polyangiaceae bacterium]|jgi:hypothetical protein
MAPIDWKATRLLIAVPCAEGVDPTTMTSVLDLVFALAARGVPASVSTVKGFLVNDARNALARVALDSSPADGPTHLLQVDSDMEFGPDVVVRMLERNVDVIGCPAALKVVGPPQYNLRPLTVPTTVERGAIRVEAIGTALHLTTRRVLEAVAGIAPRYLSGGYNEHARERIGLFDQLITETGHRRLDDYAFASRARSLGFDVWALLDGKTTHHGPGPLAWRCHLKEEDLGPLVRSTAVTERGLTFDLAAPAAE